MEGAYKSMLIAADSANTYQFVSKEKYWEYFNNYIAAGDRYMELARELGDCAEANNVGSEKNRKEYIKKLQVAIIKWEQYKKDLQ